MKRRLISIDIIQDIIYLLNRGYHYTDIMKLIPVCRSTLSKIAKNNNISYQGPSQKKHNYQLIESLLQEGKSPTEISKLLNIPSPSVSSISLSLGYSFKKDQGNTRYFSEVDTKMKAYLLGFIAADGYVVRYHKTNVSTFGVQVNLIDIEILHLLKTQIGNEHEFCYPRNSKMVRFTLSNKDLISDLYNLGITERKSKTLVNVLDKINPEFHYDFIAGYLDGDGSIIISKSPTITTLHISIRGTKALLEGFIKSLNLTNYYFHYNKTWVLSFAKKEEVYKFYLKYKTAAHQLSRKLEKFEKGISKILLKYPEVQTISST